MRPPVHPSRIAVAAALLLALGATALAYGAPGDVAAGRAQAGDAPRIVTVVKLREFGWFERMARTGSGSSRSAAGSTRPVRGPARGERGAAGRAACGAVIAERGPRRDHRSGPTRRPTLEPVLRSAREAGIVVVTHEASQPAQHRRRHRGLRQLRLRPRT